MIDFKTLSENLNLTEEDFKRKFNFYKRIIDYFTFGRIDYEDEEQKGRVLECILELINYDLEDKKKIEHYNKDGIKSEAVGTQRVEYLTLDLDTLKKLKDEKSKRIYNTIKIYIGLTGLMYRGVDYVTKHKYDNL